MKTKSRSVAAVVAAAMLAGAVPSRAEPTMQVVYGFLILIGATLGIVAYQQDIGGAGDKPLEIRDESGREKMKKKDGARIELVPPPAREEAEGQPQEFAAGIALTAKF